MKILRLYIKNCGVFKSNLIDFTHKGEHQDIVCLSGVNGSGKTTIMELILNMINFINPKLSMSNIFFDRLKPNVLTRADFVQLDLLVDDKILSLALGDLSETIKQEDSPKKQYFIVEHELKALILNFENGIVKSPDDKNEYFTERLDQLKSYSNTEQVLNRKTHNTAEPSHFPTLAKIAGLFANNIKNDDSLPFIYFFNAHDREIQDIRYTSIPKYEKSYRIAQRYHPEKEDLKKILIYYEYAYEEEFNSFKAWANQHVLVGKAIDKIDRPNFQVLIKTAAGNTHTLDLLSTGEENLLVIASQLYFKATRNAVFLIDEIDESLHPEFQEKIMSLLKQIQKDKGCQIILSSHSEIIWNTFGDKGLIDLTDVVL
jgi:ABC-type lipoprotein export system ATPase subunit